MNNETHELELHVVIQFGGSSGEQYLHSFLNEAAAQRFIKSAAKAAYRCLGPFPLVLDGVLDLAGAAKNVTKWANREGVKCEDLSRLARSLARVKKEFQLR